MPTARERMLFLSSLPTGNQARAHFLSITQTGGGPLQIFAELDVKLMADLEAELEPELEVELEPELVVLLEPELTVEVCT